MLTSCWATAQQYHEDAVKISGHWNNISSAAYVQDNWRVTHRLTLNLGLRWDGIPHTYEANQQSSNFYPNLYNPANAATFDSNGNICSVNSVSGVRRRTESRVGYQPESDSGGIAVLYQRHRYRRQEWDSQGSGE